MDPEPSGRSGLSLLLHIYFVKDFKRNVQNAHCSSTEILTGRKIGSSTFFRAVGMLWLVSKHTAYPRRTRAGVCGYTCVMWCTPG